MKRRLDSIQPVQRLYVDGEMLTVRTHGMLHFFEKYTFPERVWAWLDNVAVDYNLVLVFTGRKITPNERTLNSFYEVREFDSLAGCLAEVNGSSRVAGFATNNGMRVGEGAFLLTDIPSRRSGRIWTLRKASSHGL